jgi:hypothetical protein
MKEQDKAIRSLLTNSGKDNAQLLKEFERLSKEDLHLRFLVRSAIMPSGDQVSPAFRTAVSNINKAPIANEKTFFDKFTGNRTIDTPIERQAMQNAPAESLINDISKFIGKDIMPWAEEMAMLGRLKGTSPYGSSAPLNLWNQLAPVDAASKKATSSLIYGIQQASPRGYKMIVDMIDQANRLRAPASLTSAIDGADRLNERFINKNRRLVPQQMVTKQTDINREIFGRR